SRKSCSLKERRFANCRPNKTVRQLPDKPPLLDCCHATLAPITYPMERRWIVAQTFSEANNDIPWADICGLPCIAELLKRKGFSCADDVGAFLQPRLRSLTDPFLLPNMAAAVERILAAIDRRERIVLFGDYDVDGVTSLALLAELLRSYGANPELFLPLRMEEGYGLSP